MIKTDLIEFLKSHPIGYTSEKNFQKHFPFHYNEIIKINFPDDFTFSQKIYHYLNDDLSCSLGLCPTCHKRTKYKGINIGYLQHCSPTCSSIDKNVQNKTKMTCLQKYGVDVASKSTEIKNKQKQTCLQKYGVDNYSKTQEYIEKVKNTNNKKYSCDFFVQTKQFKTQSIKTKIDKYNDGNFVNTPKIKETKLKLYGDENYNNIDKIKTTTIQKYGSIGFANEQLRKKSEHTNLQQNGDIHYNNPTKIKESLNNRTSEQKQITKEKHQLNWQNKSEEEKTKIKQKRENTCLQKYNVEYFAQLPENIERQRNYMLNISEEEKQNRLKKTYNTKRKNKSFNTSKIEKQTKEYLIKNNISFKEHYKTNQYPFVCDFYLPDYDLYIEINGIWTHGEHPFDSTNIKDIEQLNVWIEKSNHSKFYKNAINVWTKRDVLKRNTAKQNKLNFLEIFSTDITEVIKQIKERII